MAITDTPKLAAAMSLVSSAIARMHFHMPVQLISLKTEANHLSYVAFGTDVNDLLDEESVRRHITVSCALHSASRLATDHDATSSGCASEFQRALTIAQRWVADTRYDLDDAARQSAVAALIKECTEAADRLVDDNEAHIRYAAGILVREGKLTGHELQQIIGGK